MNSKISLNAKFFESMQTKRDRIRFTTKWTFLTVYVVNYTVFEKIKHPFPELAK